MATSDIDAFFARVPNGSRPSALMVPQPWPLDPSVSGLPLVRAYVDETGDRGKPGLSSPIFGMAGVVVTDHGERDARAALRQLRSDFSTPPGRPLSWKNDLDTHERRVHAAKVLAGVAGLTVVYVAADKAALRPATYRDDATVFYNVIAYETFKRIIWTSSRMPTGPHRVAVRFGHVAKHPNVDTLNYFLIKRREGADRVPYDLVTQLDWVNAGQFDMSQVADVYAGFLKAATWPNKWGDVEGAYLLQIWHQIRNSHQCVLTLGLQYRPDSQLIRKMPWWPCKNCTSRY